MRYYFYMILASLFAGTIGVLVKLIGDSVHFMTLPFYRVFFAFIFLLLVVPFIDKSTFKIRKKDAVNYFFVGMLVASTIATFAIANVFAPVHNVSLLSNFAPFIVLILGYYILKERITRTHIITLLIAIVGIIIMNPFKFGPYLIGNALAFLDSFIYAFYIVLARKQDKGHSIGDVVWFFFFATLVTLPLPLIFGFGNFSDAWVYLILLGAAATGVQHLFFNLSLQKIEAEIGSLIAMIAIPLVAITLAVIVLREQISFRVLIGGLLLIIAGVYLQLHKRKLKRE